METKIIRDTDTARFEPPGIHRWDRFGVMDGSDDDELFGHDYSIISGDRGRLSNVSKHI